MRKYLEGIELLSKDVLTVPEFIRADITGKTEKEIADIQADIEAIMEGKAYRLIRHLCRHDSYEACDSGIIKEVR